jgi:mannose-6-phosphate isomerase-like protein (cupin superfamily)
MKLRMLFLSTLCCCFIVARSVDAQQQQQSPPQPATSQRALVYLPPDSPGWKVTAKDTLGAYTLAESIVQPQTGPEPHRHSREDEAWYVLEGQLEVRVGERVMVAAPGAFVFAPRGIPHNYKNVGTTPAKALVIRAPAGLEKFFEEREALTKELPTTDPAYPGRYKALAEKYGLEYSSDWSFPPKE